MHEDWKTHMHVGAVVVTALAMSVASGCGTAGRVPAQAYDRCLSQAQTVGVAPDVCETLGTRPTVAGWDARNVHDGWLRVSTDCYRWDNVVTVCADGRVTR